MSLLRRLDEGFREPGANPRRNSNTSKRYSSEMNDAALDSKSASFLATRPRRRIFLFLLVLGYSLILAPASVDGLVVPSAGAPRRAPALTYLNPFSSSAFGRASSGSSILCYTCGAFEQQPCSNSSEGDGGGGVEGVGGDDGTAADGLTLPLVDCEDLCFISVSLESQSSVRRGCASDVAATPTTPRRAGHCVRSLDAIWCFCGAAGCNGADVFRVLEESDECGPDNPCRNGGLCADRVAEFECTCPQGFYGDMCETFDGCRSGPCLNAATCVNLDIQEFVCECRPGFVGRFCEIEVDECASTPCKNGATCVDRVNGYTCACGDAFTGRHCETPEDACTSSPCANGGSCRTIRDEGEIGGVGSGSVSAGFFCQCRAGFGGRRCRDVTDFCVFEPCRNGGTCRGFGGPNYICECLAGFLGRNCEVSLVDPCLPNPCLNEGTCVNTPGGDFECKCPPLWIGRHCDVSAVDTPPRDPCVPNPCGDNGVCREIRDGDFECVCLHGFMGPRCREVADACSSNPCVNEGTCALNDDGTFHCFCPPPFGGRLCQETIDPCWPNPCRNQGACAPDMSGVSGASRFICTCLPGYAGAICETPVSRCSPVNPCQNGGICEERAGGKFKCTCSVGFHGPTCGIQPSPCIPSPCLNNGVCITRGSVDYECECATDFSGPHCENASPSPACSLRPCLNSGLCIPLPFNTFKCKCPPSFTGKTCGQNIGCAAGNKCTNGATCIDDNLNGGYTCQCTPNFEGIYCEIPKQASFSCLLRRDGLYSKPADPCTPVYYVCSMGKLFRMACPQDTVFNPFSSVCDWPHRMNCGQ